jgi:hypothetical protein
MWSFLELRACGFNVMNMNDFFIQADVGLVLTYHRGYEVSNYKHGARRRVVDG